MLTTRARQPSFAEVWTQLEEGIRQALAREPMSTTRYMELYTLCYNYCARVSDDTSLPNKQRRVGRTATPSATSSKSSKTIYTGFELYVRLKGILETHLQALTAQAVEETGENLLVFYSKAWEEYTFSSKVINGIFGYLNRHWIRRETDEGNGWVLQVYQVALETWKETIFEALHPSISKGVFQLFEAERSGNLMNGLLATRVISSFIDIGLTDFGDDGLPPTPSNNPLTRMPPRMALGTYQTLFELPLLADIREFYFRESDEFLRNHNNSVTDYIQKAVQRLAEEEERSGRYLHQTSIKKVRLTLEDVLIRARLDELHGEFLKLVKEERRDDLGNLYSLVCRLENGIVPIAEKFRAYVVEQGQIRIAALGDTDGNEPKQFVTAVLDVYNQYRGIVATSFVESSPLMDALERACSEFINRNAITAASSIKKPPQLLARYCDILLRNGIRDGNRDELEAGLDSAMILFRLLEEKDVFQKYYSQLLANRLVMQSSSSDDAEGSMIAKLKHCCGFEYVAKLQRMFQDVGISKDLNDDFKKYVRERSPESAGIDLQAQVLSSGSWPFQQCSSDFTLPAELVPGVNSFTLFYNEKHSGRKLIWLYSRSRGDLVTNCFQSRYYFQVSAYQMAVLLMYNRADSYSFQEIMDATKISAEILAQVIAHLVKPRLLECPDQTLSPESRVNLFLGYKHKKLRVNFNFPLRTEVKREEDQTEKCVEEDRKLVIQACIVRIMKTRKSMAHQQLLAEVMEQISSRFKPAVPSIKKCIDILMEKEYLERDGEKKDTYNYLA